MKQTLHGYIKKKKSVFFLFSGETNLSLKELFSLECVMGKRKAELI